MIPVGNWEDRIDELENDVADLEDERDDLQLTNDYLVDENAELQSALNAADTDIADYLFELDHLRKEHSELQQDVEGVLLLVEYWQEKAANASARADEYGTQLADEIKVSKRFEQQFRDAELEIETLQAEKRHDAIAYLTIDGESLENYTRVNELTKELAELKAALRTLGGEKEN